MSNLDELNAAQYAVASDGGHQSHPPARVPRPRGRWLPWVLIDGFAACGLAVAVLLVLAIPRSSRPREYRTYEVTSLSLVASYASNEVAAEDKYGGQVVTVTGPIKRVARDAGEPVVIMEAGRGRVLFRDFRWDDRSAFAAIRPGQVWTITGQCSGGRGDRVTVEPARLACGPDGESP